MNHLYNLLAAAEPYPAHASRQGGMPLYLLLLAAVAVVALAITGLYLWNSFRKLREAPDEASSASLFTELCDAHQLSHAERLMLLHVARNYDLAQPSMLFVEQSILNRAAAATDPDAPRFDALRTTLYGLLN